MSDYERHKGKLIKVEEKQGESFDDMLLRILKENQIDVVESKDNLSKYFISELYGSYYIHKDILYIIDNVECDDTEDIADASINPDGSISYSLRYYNGGCGFGEALDYALKSNKI